MLLRSLFRNLSLFLLCYLYRSIPLLRPLVCSRSIPPINFLFLSSFSTLTLDFLSPFPLLLSISCSSFYYSHVEIPSQEYTIFPVFFHCVVDTSSCCLHLFTVHCYYFAPFIAYMNFCFHASFFFSFFPFSFFFLLRDLPICTLSVATFLFVLLFRFLFSLSIYLFIHLLFEPFLDG
jgi:hypothetical protein